VIALSQFNKVAFKPSKRLTRCKNCDDWSGLLPVNTPIQAGEARIVVVGGFGPATRHVTLCVECARQQLSQLESLTAMLRDSLQAAGKRLEVA
jgi:hypothetical protein